jgi:hypothetical protein
MEVYLSVTVDVELDPLIRDAAAITNTHGTAIKEVTRDAIFKALIRQEKEMSFDHALQDIATINIMDVSVDENTYSMATTRESA